MDWSVGMEYWNMVSLEWIHGHFWEIFSDGMVWDLSFKPEYSDRSSSSSRAAHVPQRGPGQVKKKKEIGIFSNSHFQKPIPTLFGLAAQEIFMAFAYPASSHCTNVTSK